jgi:hypothetical protein
LQVTHVAIRGVQLTDARGARTLTGDRPEVRMRNVRCLLARHRWAVGSNDDGERFRQCRRCGAIKDELPPGFGLDTPGPAGG